MFEKRGILIDKINHFSERGEPFLFAVDFDAENGFVLTPGEAAERGIRYDFGTGKKQHGRIGQPRSKFEFTAIPFETYKKAFDRVMTHLERGDTYLLNLTFPTPLSTDLTQARIFETSDAPYKLFVPGHFLLFSPELFVKIEANRIISRPMKGTIDASLPDAAQRLLADQKELFEHNTIVDLIRNDLSMVSTHVEVNRFRYLDLIRTNRGDLLQMSSEISGELPADYRKRLGEILFTLLPAGSVTGAPKEKTVEIIRSTEQDQRGFYTGISGYSDGHCLVSAVSIRFIEQQESTLVFRSGGGITALSDAGSEYHEMLKKIYVPIV